MRRIVTTSILALVVMSCVTGCGLFGRKKNAETSADAYQPTVYQEPAAGGTDAYAQPAYGAPGSANAYPTASGRVHVVQKKDTLFSLARMYYSDQSKWKDIYEANRSDISDPNRIRVGQKLTIP